MSEYQRSKNVRKADIHVELKNYFPQFLPYFTLNPFLNLDFVHKINLHE